MIRFLAVRTMHSCGIQFCIVDEWKMNEEIRKGFKILGKLDESGLKETFKNLEDDKELKEFLSDEEEIKNAISRDI